MWWIRGVRIGHDLLSFPGVRLVLPQDGRMEATTRNAVNGRSEPGRNGQVIEPRVVVQGYRLGRIWDLREGESRLEFRDRTAAAGFLQRLATDPCVLATLRSTHAGVDASSAIHRLGDRVVLNIVDALICQYEGEERSLLHYSTVLNQLRFSRDPVALDVLSLQELDHQRQDAKAPPVKLNPELYNNASLLELGVSNLKKIQVENIR